MDKMMANITIDLEEKGEKVYVLDTSYFLNSFPIEGIFYIPSSVLEEAKTPILKIKIENLNPTIVDPRRKYRKIVEKAAKELGILNKLSKTDIDVLALALELDATVVTNDYQIQNLASYLGIKFEGLRKIKKQIKWVYYCENCKIEFNENLERCPYCGRKLKRIVKKVKKVENSIS